MSQSWLFTRNDAEPEGSFFPTTCHQAVTRRGLLLGGGALLAMAPVVLRHPPAFARVVDDGTAIVQRYSTTPDDPWVVAHGVRAMGRDFRLKDGRRAVDYLLGKVVSVPANGKTALGFPNEVEGHPNMFLDEVFLGTGVSLDYPFVHDGQQRRVSDLVDGARLLLRPTLVSAIPNALPWTVAALTRTTSSLRKPWTNAWGEPVDLDALVEGALRLLEQASLPLARAMQDGRAESTKAPVHEFTCGGTHMIYALLTAIAEGYTGKDRVARMQRQVDLLVWRLGADVELIDRFYRALPVNAKTTWYELDAKLKLLGHAEECLALATSSKVASLTPQQRSHRQAAVAQLGRLIKDLEGRNLTEAKALDGELYRHLVGDTCHARHGLSLA